jgi:DNA modification methylase
LIAAQQEGRRCFAMEISPIYCDVAVARWEAYTGQKATRQAGTAAPEKTSAVGRAEVKKGGKK